MNHKERQLLVYAFAPSQTCSLPTLEMDDILLESLKRHIKLRMFLVNDSSPK